MPDSMGSKAAAVDPAEAHLHSQVVTAASAHQATP